LFSSIVKAVGPQVISFKVNDIVAAAQKFGAISNQYSMYQRYVIARDKTASKILEGIDIVILASLTRNLSTIIGLFNRSARLDIPNFNGSEILAKGKKVLVYSSLSSFGSLSVQYII
jgi:NADPH:quinone reductase-like Zn-dependent oxidoreductase